MKRVLSYAYMVALVLSLVGYGVAGASSSQLAIATRDYKTPPPTPTVGGYDFSAGNSANTDCPITGIANLGSVTPDPLWLSLCSRCLPTETAWPTVGFPTARPTKTYVFATAAAGTGVPTEVTYTPSSSPTPSKTPTSTPTATLASLCDPSFPTATPLPTKTVQITSTYPNTVTAVATSTTVGSQNNVLPNSSFSYSGTYSGPTSCSNNCSDNAYYALQSSGAAEYAFVGTAFTWYGIRNTGHGVCEFFIDNVSQGTYNEDNGSLIWYVTLLSVTGLSNISHTARIAWNSGGSCVFDGGMYVSVGNTPTPVPSRTPYPTYTIQPTATSVVGGVHCNSSGTYWTCLQDTGAFASMKFERSDGQPAQGGGTDIVFSLSPHDVPFQITYKVTISHTELSGFCGNWVGDYLSASIIGGSSVFDNGRVIFTSSGCDVSGAYSTYGYATVTSVSGDGRLDFHFGTDADYPTSAGSFVAIVDVYAYIQCSIITATAVPTGTAVPDLSYCASVNHGTGDLGNQDIVFWQAVPDTLVCRSIPAFSTADWASIFNWMDFVFPSSVLSMIADFITYLGVSTPAVTVCVQAYEFLPIPLFGFVFVLQTFLDLTIGLWIVSHFMNK